MAYVAILTMAACFLALVFLVGFGCAFFYTDNVLYSHLKDRVVESVYDAGRLTGVMAMVVAAVVAFVFILSIFVPFS